MSSTIRTKTILILSAIALLTLLAYEGSLHGNFVFDDESGIVANTAIRDLWKIKEVLFYNSELPRPLFNLSLALNWALSTNNPYSYHVVNLAFHMINVYLIFVLLSLFLKGGREKVKEYAPFIGAGIFAVHPICTESVSFIWSRSTLMMSTFYLGALIVFIKSSFKKKSSRRDSATISFLFLLAILSKEEAITLPVAVVLLDLLSLEKTGRRERFYRLHLPLWGMVLTLVVYRAVSGLTMFDAVSWRKIQSDEYSNALMEHGLVGMVAVNFLTQLKVMLMYLRRLVWPFGLNVDHMVGMARSPLDAWALFGFAGIVGGVWGAYRLAKEEKAVGLAATLFIAPLVIFFVLPLADIMVERRAYLPCAGWSVALALAISYALEPGDSLKWPWDGESRQVIVIFMAVSIMVCGVFLSQERNKVWASNLNLWKDAHFKAPQKLRPRTNLAMAYFDAGLDFRAETENVAVLNNTPHYNDALRNLAVVYMDNKDYHKARRFLEMAVHFKPNADYQSYFNLGVLSEKEGKLDEAEKHYLKSTEIRPDYSPAYSSLGAMMARKGRVDEAVKYLTEASKLSPYDYKPVMDLGKLYLQMQFYDEAGKKFQEAVKLAPEAAITHFNLGGFHMGMKNLAEAEKQLGEAVKLDAGFILARLEYGRVLAANGKTNDAGAQFKRAAELAREKKRPDLEKRALDFLDMLNGRQP